MCDGKCYGNEGMESNNPMLSGNVQTHISYHLMSNGKRMAEEEETAGKIEFLRVHYKSGCIS